MYLELPKSPKQYRTQGEVNKTPLVQKQCFFHFYKNYVRDRIIDQN